MILQCEKVVSFPVDIKFTPDEARAKRLEVEARKMRLKLLKEGKAVDQEK